MSNDIYKRLQAQMREGFAQQGIEEDWAAEWRAKRDSDDSGHLRAALARIMAAIPAVTLDGALYFAHFDADGNEVGVEYVDPLAVIQTIQAIAEEALNRAALGSNAGREDK